VDVVIIVIVGAVYSTEHYCYRRGSVQHWTLLLSWGLCTALNITCWTPVFLSLLLP